MNPWIRYFNDINKDDLCAVGGKGANLGEMTRAGFPVPPGFCITTAAYQTFLNTSQPMPNLLAELEHIYANDLARICTLGETIRNHLVSLPIPPAISHAIIDAWKQLGCGSAYAVRSSATAEDLPTASFAGQQDTYLNILGENSLLNAVRRCWASLFTDRAISYRMKNGFDHRQVQLAVVVQQMIFPAASGILFTADPITGNRRVTTIDASFGLGEALVSGLVSADGYKVKANHIIARNIPQKKLAVYPLPQGGTIQQEIPPAQQHEPALTDEQVLHLSGVGQQIAAHYGAPQDIEWCYTKDSLYIVQSRPITSLYPLPSFGDDTPHLLVSAGHIQMMTEPLTPLGLSLFQLLFPGVYEAGGRAYIDMAPLLSIKPLRRRLPHILRHMDEQLGLALTEAIHRTAFRPTEKKFISLRQVWPVGRRVLKIIRRNLFATDPDSSRLVADTAMTQSVQACRTRLAQTTDYAKLDTIQRDLTISLPHDLISVVPHWISSLLAAALIRKLAQRWLHEPFSFDIIDRSLPGNVTSEMGLLIGDLADVVRTSPTLADHLTTRTDANFYEDMASISGGPEFLELFTQFISRYGMRCPGEIDVGKPRWQEAPTALVPAILGHMRSVGASEHRVRWAAGAADARNDLENLVKKVRVRRGKIRARVMRRLLHVYRGLAGLREHHKYLVVQHLSVYREALLEEANAMVADGTLRQPSDIFYLSIGELKALTSNPSTLNVQSLVAERRQQYVRNHSLTPPRVMTEDGEIITGQRQQQAAPPGALLGTPVSAGVAEGYARVVLDPAVTQLNPGQILVAPFTDPGWTPLFQSAQALVMEIGGLMTHGALVAREYGIPAVAGIDQATHKIKDGDYIRVDGTQGYVQILADGAHSAH